MPIQLLDLVERLRRPLGSCPGLHLGDRTVDYLSGEVAAAFLCILLRCRIREVTGRRRHDRTVAGRHAESGLDAHVLLDRPFGFPLEFEAVRRLGVSLGVDRLLIHRVDRRLGTVQFPVGPHLRLPLQHVLDMRDLTGKIRQERLFDDLEIADSQRCDATADVDIRRGELCGGGVGENLNQRSVRVGHLMECGQKVWVGGENGCLVAEALEVRSQSLSGDRQRSGT